MINEAYIPIPITIALFSELIFPYLHTLRCDKVWYSPPLFFCILMFLGIYCLLGFTLYKSVEIDNDKIYAYCFVLTFLNILWGYYIFSNIKKALIVLFITMLFAYFCYNTIFLSPLTDNENTLYLNLFTVYIIWIGFMISISFEHSRGLSEKK